MLPYCNIVLLARQVRFVAKTKFLKCPRLIDHSAAASCFQSLLCISHNRDRVQILLQSPHCFTTTTPASYKHASARSAAQQFAAGNTMPLHCTNLHQLAPTNLSRYQPPTYTKKVIAPATYPTRTPTRHYPKSPRNGNSTKGVPIVNGGPSKGLAGVAGGGGGDRKRFLAGRGGARRIHHYLGRRLRSRWRRLGA